MATPGLRRPETIFRPLILAKLRGFGTERPPIGLRTSFALRFHFTPRVAAYVSFASFPP
jgi:hypothetical protein